MAIVVGVIAWDSIKTNKKPDHKPKAMTSKASNNSSNQTTAPQSGQQISNTKSVPQNQQKPKQSSKSSTDSTEEIKSGNSSVVQMRSELGD